MTRVDGYFAWLRDRDGPCVLQQRTRVLGRECVTYVMGILGNRDGPRDTGGDVFRVHEDRELQC